MASASSLAHFNSTSSAEKGVETLEIDPQFAQGLGFSSGDVVRTIAVAPMSELHSPFSRWRSVSYTTSDMQSLLGPSR